MRARWEVGSSNFQKCGKAHETRSTFDFVFLDPPYEAGEEYAATLNLLGGRAASLIENDAWIVAEHRRKDCLAESYGALTRFRLLEQGDAALSFFARSAEE